MLEGEVELGIVLIGENPAAAAPVEHSQPKAEPPAHTATARVEHRNITLLDEAGKEVFKTTDGTPDAGYSDRLHVSPDGRFALAMWHTPEQEHKIHMIESSPADQTQPKLKTIDYLKPGDRIAQEWPRLVDLVSRRVVVLDTALFANPWSIEEVHWSKDSSTVYFVYNQRGHEVVSLCAVDAASGRVREVTREQHGAFIDYVNSVRVVYLDDTHEVVWVSERDGWRHIFLIDLDTGSVKSQITKGPWVVRDMELLDVAHREVWFWAGGIYPQQDPYYLHLARVRFDSSGLVVITEGDGTHEAEFSPDRSYILDRFSRVDLPPVTQVRRTSDGSLVMELGRADWSKLLSVPWVRPERFVAKGRDGVTDIYGIIVRPSTFDPVKKYPVIEQIYAGPHSAFVPKKFSTHLGAQEMAELGFIVVQIDGMGTAHRSRAFHEVAWKNLVDAGLPDRIAWMKAAGAKYAQMDLTRVGIYGGSAGGQNALAAVLTHGEFYKAASADCGCHDNRMDKIWWNELWMGWPIGEHYARNSNVTLAPNLKGDLLLIVGELDTNVDPASTMQVVNALIKADKRFELLVVPGSDHGAAGHPYAKRRQQEFFLRSFYDWKPPRATD
jgi:dipeptidyl aminopeptidase/acylaminoacyl peptidase